MALWCKNHSGLPKALKIIAWIGIVLSIIGLAIAMDCMEMLIADPDAPGQEMKIISIVGTAFTGFFLPMKLFYTGEVMHNTEVASGEWYNDNKDNSFFDNGWSTRANWVIGLASFVFILNLLSGFISQDEPTNITLSLLKMIVACWVTGWMSTRIVNDLTGNKGIGTVAKNFFSPKWIFSKEDILKRPQSPQCHTGTMDWTNDTGAQASEINMACARVIYDATTVIDSQMPWYEENKTTTITLVDPRDSDIDMKEECLESEADSSRDATYGSRTNITQARVCTENDLVSEARSDEYSWMTDRTNVSQIHPDYIGAPEPKSSSESRIPPSEDSVASDRIQSHRRMMRIAEHQDRH